MAKMSNKQVEAGDLAAAKGQARAEHRQAGATVAATAEAREEGQDRALSNSSNG
jgi:hypothetical protein